MEILTCKQQGFSLTLFNFSLNNLDLPTKQKNTRPFPHQLQSIYQILDMLPAIRENADRELRKNAYTYEKLKDWKNTFYCAAITPLDVEQREFEIAFEPADESDTRYVLVSWKNGQLTEIEGK